MATGSLLGMKSESKDLSQEEVENVRSGNLQINFLKDIFFVFDKGRDGDISCTEIKNLLAKFGFEHSLKDIDDMIREKDLDQDGRINFDEFYRIISRDTSSLGIDLLPT